MASAEQENAELRREVGNLKEGMEKMAAMMEAMMTAQAEAQAQAQVPATIFQAPADIPLVQPIPAATIVGTPQTNPTAAVTSTSITPPLVTESPVNDMYNAVSRPPGYSYTPQYRMPPGYLWGMPIEEDGHHVNSENPFPHGRQSAPIYQSGQTFPRATVTYAKPHTHTIPPEEEPVYHSDSVVGDDRMGNLEEKFDAVQRELRNI